MKKAHADVLIAEDNAFLAGMMAKIIKANDVGADVVHDGKNAVEFLKKQSPNLVLLDLLMPGSDGFEVLAYLKENKSRVPVVILSNLSDNATRKRCETFGVKEYYVKSDIDEDQIWSVVKKWLR